jgi:hypothetical protein
VLLNVTCEVLTAVTIKSTAFWNVTPCSQVESSTTFRFVSRQLLAGYLPGLLFSFELGGNMFLRNFDELLPTTRRHIRQHSTLLSLNELRMTQTITGPNGLDNLRTLDKSKKVCDEGMLWNWHMCRTFSVVIIFFKNRQRFGSWPYFHHQVKLWNICCWSPRIENIFI